MCPTGKGAARDRQSARSPQHRSHCVIGGIRAWPTTRAAQERIRRSGHAARDNPIATAIVERAAAIAARDHSRLVRFAATFAQLGCPYQQARTVGLAAGLR